MLSCVKKVYKYVQSAVSILDFQALLIKTMFFCTSSGLSLICTQWQVDLNLTGATAALSEQANCWTEHSAIMQLHCTSHTTKQRRNKEASGGGVKINPVTWKQKNPTRNKYRRYFIQSGVNTVSAESAFNPLFLLYFFFLCSFLF